LSRSYFTIQRNKNGVPSEKITRPATPKVVCIVMCELESQSMSNDLSKNRLEWTRVHEKIDKTASFIATYTKLAVAKIVAIANVP